MSSFLGKQKFSQKEYVKQGDFSFFYNKKNKMVIESAQKDVDEAKELHSKYNRLGNGINILKENSLKSSMKNDYKNILENNMLSLFGKIYYDALPIDENAKEQFKLNIYNYFVEDFRGKNFDFKKLKENSDYLHEIISEAEKISMNEFDKQFNSQQNLLEKVKMTNLSEKNILDYNQEDNDILHEASKGQKVDDISKLFNAVGDVEDSLLKKNVNIKNISDVIKDSVIETVKDEEEQSRKEKEIVDDIVASKSLNESVTTHTQGRDSYTFFRSLMIGNYKKIITESNKLTESTEYTNINENGDIKVDMDKVLLESILVYTLNEMYYKMYMIDYNCKDLRDLSNKIAYDNK